MFMGPQIGLFFSPRSSLSFKYLYNDSPRRARGNERLSVNPLDPESLVSHELTVNWRTDKVYLDATV